MPLYDVRCKSCGSEFEVFSKISERDTIRCKCGGDCAILITNSRFQDWFRPHWNRNFDGRPIFVRSRSHFKQLCRRYDMTPVSMGDVRNIAEV